jgi:hypothetical protein
MASVAVQVLTPWSRVFIEKLLVLSYSRKYWRFVEKEN